MKNPIRYCIVVGSSTGLGAALVNEFINQTAYNIIGIAKTKYEKIDSYNMWKISGRYRHVEMDITSPACGTRLKLLCSEFLNDPVCVIFNAAYVETDIKKDGYIDYDVFMGVNHVGINGLGNVLSAFGDYLLKCGGIFVGISSFSAFTPPVSEKRIAYPATKAYLDMALRCLRLAWLNKVRVVTVHLGHIRKCDGTGSFFDLITPTYPMVARKITGSLLKKKVPNEINYPLLYNVFYRYVLRFIPDKLYFYLFGWLLKSRGIK
ncbi:MAG: SDR family NAD(P)-dependent oxidoreductase [Candidatus Auribacterota bacterium]|nr:SDR family NAD(P)-dependent oxidoreductase [Candidatus Auribacterota bacterium]